jgi:hypothetical protein
MSPNEFQLRAVLHEGEGEDLDANRIIARARAIRHERRVRFASVAAVVAVVTGVGVAGGLALTDNQHGSSSSRAEKRAAGGNGSSNFDSGASAPHAVSSGTCPATVPQLLLPGGGSPGQFGADGPLFEEPVGSITVCGYTADKANPLLPQAVVVSGAEAGQVAASAEAAPQQPTGSSCGASAAGDISSFLLVATSTTGAAMDPVVDTVCGTVTNGTALRYDWQPPATIVDALRGRQVVGSPIRS